MFNDCYSFFISIINGKNLGWAEWSVTPNLNIENYFKYFSYDCTMVVLKDWVTKILTHFEGLPEVVWCNWV